MFFSHMQVGKRPQSKRGTIKDVEGETGEGGQ
jgi:hypothetical protein